MLTETATTAAQLVAGIAHLDEMIGKVQTAIDGNWKVSIVDLFNPGAQQSVRVVASPDELTDELCQSLFTAVKGDLQARRAQLVADLEAL